MKNPITRWINQSSWLLLSPLCFFANHTLAHGEDDPLLAKVIIDQLEWRRADEGKDPWVLEAQGWIGKDLNKLWLKADLEQVDGETEEASVQALYSRGLTAFWDLQVGLRHDARPEPTRDWAVFGVQGLAPWFFEVDAALFVSDEGETSLGISAEYEIMLTQKWVLSPELALTFKAWNDAESEAGSGLADIHSGLRLRYEIRRELAPYVGLSWAGKYGKTADFAGQEGHDLRETQWLAGVRAWF